MLLAAVALTAGCQGPVTTLIKPPPPPLRVFPQDVSGDLTPARLREVYGTPAFVVRTVEGDHYVGVQDTALAPEVPVDDTNLLIIAEGAGDTVVGFRWTAGLLAASPHGFSSEPDHLVILVIHWSETALAVAEHLNRPAQLRGAALLGDMLEVHRRRHGDAGCVSLIAFSAGTRVTEMAFLGELPEGAEARPDALARIQNIVFLGSSVWCHDPAPFESIRGRFINFINPRDTHFGDRAAYAAPAGTSPRVVEWFEQGTLLRRPHFGASVVGFADLPTLTTVAQFNAIDAVLRDDDADTAEPIRAAFQRLNVPVPHDLVPYSLFGDPIPDDDLDDYLNLAPNHYILVGRGPGGNVEAPEFKQYRAIAEEFVQEHVACAAFGGRLERFDLRGRSQGANPLKVPLPVPWAVFETESKEAEKEEGKDAPSPSEQTPQAPSSPDAPPEETQTPPDSPPSSNAPPAESPKAP